MKIYLNPLVPVHHGNALDLTNGLSPVRRIRPHNPSLYQTTRKDANGPVLCLARNVHAVLIPRCDLGILRDIATLKQEAEPEDWRWPALVNWLERATRRPARGENLLVADLHKRIQKIPQDGEISTHVMDLLRWLSGQDLQWSLPITPGRQ